MKNNPNLNKRYYTNQRQLNYNNNSIQRYLEQNNVRNLKIQSNIRRYQNKNKDISTNSTNANKSQNFPNINLNNLQRTIIDECEDSLINKRKGDSSQNKPNHEFYHKKKYFSKDLTTYSSSLNDNPYSNLGNKSSTGTGTGTGTGHKNYKKYKEKKNIYKNRINDNSYDYIIGEYKSLYNANSRGKSNNKNMSSTSYDFKKISLKRPNSRGEKKIPVIVVSKKSKKNKTSMNFFKRKDYIIKIQSVWRGYFLRKIAVGSIKKYIGFIALVKYMEKIFFNNIEYLYYEFVFLLGKYHNQKSVYKKINNKN